MKPNVNIVVLVDVVGALSDGTLHNGNLSLIDDGQFDSAGQGTTDLCTVVAPGQVVQWSAVAVDVQTPVEIRSISFLGAPGPPPAGGGGQAGETETKTPDVLVWSGIVPAHLVPGARYGYRLELQMHEGRNSVLGLETAALMCA